MLQKQAVESSTLDLVVKFCRQPFIDKFFLVGGTALALQIGHRKSVDIDMFTVENFDAEELRNFLIETYDMKLLFAQKNTLIGTINNIKVDFIAHAYPLKKELLIIEEARMASLEDIAAMKLNAITFSGTRLKDFVDLYFLLEKISLAAMLETFDFKYPNTNRMIAKKALTYYADINPAEKLQVLRKSFTVEKMKKRLQQAVKYEERIFENEYL